jgi:N-acetylmuramoyl-L-alanine amidase
VVALQAQLQSLGYWVDDAHGQFGDSTQQAVYALQKTAGIIPDGIVGPNTEASLAAKVIPRPLSTNGYAVEVDLEKGLVLVVDQGRAIYVLNTSTGGGYTYTSQGVRAVADTPRGHFRVNRQVDGLVIAPLGELWRPKYFYGGFAIHGDSYVPPFPVSHGCVRVSYEAIDWIWANNLMPMGTANWIY